MRSEYRLMVDMLDKARPARNPRIKSVSLGLRSGHTYVVTDFEVDRDLLMGKTLGERMVCVPVGEIVSVEIHVNILKVNLDKLPHTFAAITTGKP